MAALHTLRDVDEAVAWLRLRLAPGADLFSDSRRLCAGDAFVGVLGCSAPRGSRVFTREDLGLLRNGRLTAAAGDASFFLGR